MRAWGYPNGSQTNATFGAWSQVSDNIRFSETAIVQSILIALDLQPQKATDGPVAINVDLKRVKGRWLIDSFFPRTSYAPTAASAEQTPAGTRSASPAAPAEPPKHTSLMWIFIAAIFGLIVLAPLTVVGVSTYRNRRAARRAI